MSKLFVHVSVMVTSSVLTMLVHEKSKGRDGGRPTVKKVRSIALSVSVSASSHRSGRKSSASSPYTFFARFMTGAIILTMVPPGRK